MSKSVNVYNMQGEEVGKVDLSRKVFDGIVNKAVLYQVKVMYEANMRQGTAATKTRGEVRGGGKKPWRQKGTGRARVGSIRSPLWKGGGTIFGPHPRDYSYTMPQKMRALALKSALNAKLNAEELLVIDKLIAANAKTKEMVNLFKALNIPVNALILLDHSDEKVKRATRNIPKVIIRTIENVNAYDVIIKHRLITTKQALKKLSERMTKGGHNEKLVSDNIEPVADRKRDRTAKE